MTTFIQLFQAPADELSNLDFSVARKVATACAAQLIPCSLELGGSDPYLILGDADLDKDMTRLFGIIDSMTPQERRNPGKVIDQQRRRRIAAGAGVQLHEVSDLVKQFDGMAAMMKGMSGMGLRERVQQMQSMHSTLGNPAMRLGKPKGDTGKRLTAEERRRQLEKLVEHLYRHHQW